MICDICKKKHASLFLTKVVDTHVTKLQLCEACAGEKHLETSLCEDPAFEKLISELLPLAMASTAQAESEGKDRDELVCPTCELSYSKFRSRGRLGCENCYTAFEDRLVEVVEEVQKTRQHRGKVARSARSEAELLKQIERLREGIATAVEEERYEDAARLRDEIERLRKKGRSDRPETCQCSRGAEM